MGDIFPVGTDKNGGVNITPRATHRLDRPVTHRTPIPPSR
jgi:hypothetical protein